MLKEKWNPLGDIKNEKGLSYFPGNINVLVFELNSYLETLNRTRGLMPEFVNPKYADSGKNTFKSPTRLECLMQDYPQLIVGQKIGFTMFDRLFCYSPCKNNISDALAKFKQGATADSGFTIELDTFESNYVLLEKLGLIEVVNRDKFPVVKIKDAEIPFKYPKIIIKPSFAIVLKDLKEKIVHIKIDVSGALILEGYNSSGVNVELLKGLGKVKNEGFEISANRVEFVPLNEDEGLNYEKMRGYKLETS